MEWFRSRSDTLRPLITARAWSREWSSELRRTPTISVFFGCVPLSVVVMLYPSLTALSGK